MKFKRKNNFLTLIQSAGILLSVGVSLFAHSTLAAAPQISHHVMIPANDSATQVMIVSSSQVHPAAANSFSSTQSSSVQSAESSSITPLDQITLQQSESLQKNVSDSQLVINAPANLLEQPASIIDLHVLSISYASPVFTISGSAGKVSAQSLAILQSAVNHIIEPFAIGNSQQTPAQAIFPLSGQQKNNLGSPSQFNSNNLAGADIHVGNQINVSHLATASIEVLRC